MPWGSLAMLAAGNYLEPGYRYYRLHITASHAGWSYVGQLKLYVGATLVSPGNMSSTTEPSPYVVTSSYSWEGDANWRNYFIFSNLGIGWNTNPVVDAWNQIDLGARYVVNKYQLHSTPYGACPKSWVLLASNTGAFTGEEVTLDSRSNIAAWSPPAYAEYSW